MANQPEVGTYDVGVYQYETTDPVEGGLGGIANAPLLNLANRTGYLYTVTTTLTAEMATKAPITSPTFLTSAALSGVGGVASPFYFQVSGADRWSIENDGATESGGNTGSNFGIARYSDIGAFIDFPLSINRNTGVVSSSQTTALNTSGNAATATKWANARTLQVTGDLTWAISLDGSSNQSAAGTIAANAVTNAKMAPMAAATFKANVTGGSASPTDATVAQVLAALGVSAPVFSSPETVTTSYNFAPHGLSARPRLFGAQLICVTGNDGFSPGDAVNLPATTYTGAGGGNASYMYVGANATEVYAGWNNDVTISVYGPSGIQYITPADWQIMFWWQA